MIKKLIGSKITVHLKSESSSLSGIMVDIDKEHVCVQGEDISSVYIVPVENINYYTSDTIPYDTNEVVKDVCDMSEPETNNVFNRLDIFINDEYLVSIPMPPTIDLKQWNDGIVAFVSENPDVKVALDGKIQKSVEYSPGIVNIRADDLHVVEETGGSSNSFDMNSPMSSFLNPSQMVTRLQDSMRGKNDAKTNLHEMQKTNSGQSKNHNIPTDDQK